MRDHYISVQIDANKAFTLLRNSVKKGFFKTIPFVISISIKILKRPNKQEFKVAGLQIIPIFVTNVSTMRIDHHDRTSVIH